MEYLTSPAAPLCFNRHMTRQSGFTWIELLAVIAVIAILALMAVPSLHETTLRKQVKEAMSIAQVAKAGVQAAYTLGGEMPENNEAAGLPVPEKMVSALVREVRVRKGAITLTFGNNAHKGLDGKRLTLLPAVVPDEPRVPIAWLCHDVSVPKNMEVRGEDETDVPFAWLPVECRGPQPRG